LHRPVELARLTRTWLVAAIFWHYLFHVFRARLVSFHEADMKLESIGEVIASRRLTLVQQEGPPSEVFVLLGKPQQTPGFDDYYCPCQITGAGFDRLWYLCGIDTMQAIQLAMRNLCAEIELLNRKCGGRLRWNDDEKGWLGFSDP
jgi:hypothetical protein